MKMAQDHSTVYIEFCQACDTHSWCTHHDEAKYMWYFNKVASLITHEFPQINVEGNKPPSHLTPITGYDNKFYNSKTKKYINFPATGAFEITFCGQVLFSKKKTNAWPEFEELRDKIKQIKNNKLEETKKNIEFSKHESMEGSDQQNNADDMGTDKQTLTADYLDNDDVRTTFYKPKQAKSFTLTDHFKIYKMQKKQTNLKNGEKQVYAPNKPLSKIQVRSKKWQQISLKNPLSNFLKEKAYINEQRGKRQMIIDLHSIQQEVLAEDNCPSKRQKANRNNKENREVMKQWDEQLNFLQHKFKKVESSLSKIKQKNKQFDNSIELEWLNRITQQKQNIQNKESPRLNPCNRYSSHSPDDSKVFKALSPLQLPSKYYKIDKYINSSQAQKNKKLYQIYGEWKVIKKDPHQPQQKYWVRKRKQYTFESDSDDDCLKNGRKKRKTERKQRSNDRDQKQSHHFDSEHDSQFPNIDNKKKKFTQTMRQNYKFGGQRVALQAINAQKLTGKSGRQTPSGVKRNDRKITNRLPNWNNDAVKFSEFSRNRQGQQQKQDDIQSQKTSLKKNRFYITERQQNKQSLPRQSNSKDPFRKSTNSLNKKLGLDIYKNQIVGIRDQLQKQRKQAEDVSIRTKKKGKALEKQSKKGGQKKQKQRAMKQKDHLARIKQFKEQKLKLEENQDKYKLKYRGSLENETEEKEEQKDKVQVYFKGQFSDEEQQQSDNQKCERIQKKSEQNQGHQQQQNDCHDEQENANDKQQTKANNDKKQNIKQALSKIKPSKEVKNTKNELKQKEKNIQNNKNKNSNNVSKNKDSKVNMQNSNGFSKKKNEKNIHEKGLPTNKTNNAEPQEKKDNNQELTVKEQYINQNDVQNKNKSPNLKDMKSKRNEKSDRKMMKGENELSKNIVAKNNKVHSEPLDSKSRKDNNQMINKLKQKRNDSNLPNKETENEKSEKDEPKNIKLEQGQQNQDLTEKQISIKNDKQHSRNDENHIQENKNTTNQIKNDVEQETNTIKQSHKNSENRQLKNSASAEKSLKQDKKKQIQNNNTQGQKNETKQSIENFGKVNSQNEVAKNVQPILMVKENQINKIETDGKQKKEIQQQNCQQKEFKQDSENVNKQNEDSPCLKTVEKISKNQAHEREETKKQAQTIKQESCKKDQSQDLHKLNNEQPKQKEPIEQKLVSEKKINSQNKTNQQKSSSQKQLENLPEKQMENMKEHEEIVQKKPAKQELQVSKQTPEGKQKIEKLIINQQQPQQNKKQLKEDMFENKQKQSSKQIVQDQQKQNFRQHQSYKQERIDNPKQISQSPINLKEKLHLQNSTFEKIQWNATYLDNDFELMAEKERKQVSLGQGQQKQQKIPTKQKQVNIAEIEQSNNNKNSQNQPIEQQAEHIKQKKIETTDLKQQKEKFENTKQEPSKKSQEQAQKSNKKITNSEENQNKDSKSKQQYEIKSIEKEQGNNLKALNERRSSGQLGNQQSEESKKQQHNQTKSNGQIKNQSSSKQKSMERQVEGNLKKKDNYDQIKWLALVQNQQFCLKEGLSQKAEHKEKKILEQKSNHVNQPQKVDSLTSQQLPIYAQVKWTAQRNGSEFEIVQSKDKIVNQPKIQKKQIEQMMILEWTAYKSDEFQLKSNMQQEREETMISNENKKQTQNKKQNSQQKQQENQLKISNDKVIIKKEQNQTQSKDEQKMELLPNNERNQKNIKDQRHQANQNNQNIHEKDRKEQMSRQNQDQRDTTQEKMKELDEGIVNNIGMGGDFQKKQLIKQKDNTEKHEKNQNQSQKIQEKQQSGKDLGIKSVQIQQKSNKSLVIAQKNKQKKLEKDQQQNKIKNQQKECLQKRDELKKQSLRQVQHNKDQKIKQEAPDNLKAKILENQKDNKQVSQKSLKQEKNEAVQNKESIKKQYVKQQEQRMSQKQQKNENLDSIQTEQKEIINTMKSIDQQEKPLRQKNRNSKPQVNLQKYYEEQRLVRESNVSKESSFIKRISSMISSNNQSRQREEFVHGNSETAKRRQVMENDIYEPVKVSVGTQKNETTEFGFQTGFDQRQQSQIFIETIQNPANIREHKKMMKKHNQQKSMAISTNLMTTIEQNDPNLQSSIINKRASKQIVNPSKMKELKHQKRLSTKLIESQMDQNEDERIGSTKSAKKIRQSNDKKQPKQVEEVFCQKQPMKQKSKIKKIKKNDEVYANQLSENQPVTARKEKQGNRNALKQQKNNQSGQQQNEQRQKVNSKNPKKQDKQLLKQKDRKKQKSLRNRVSETELASNQKISISHSQSQLKMNSQLINPLQAFKSSLESRRAPLTAHLYGIQNSEQIKKFSSLQAIRQNSTKIESRMIGPSSKLKPLRKLYKNCELFAEDLSMKNIFNALKISNYKKALSIVHSIEGDKLIRRLFEKWENGYFGVWLCQSFGWKCFVFDQDVPVDKSDQPLYTSLERNSISQVWFLVLQKALAIYSGSYQNFQNLQLNEILHALTGANILSYKIREDLQKNAKLISSIKKCLQKHYYIFCEKHDFAIKQKDSQSTYRIQNITKTQSNEVVIQLKETNKQKNNVYWLKLEKFVQQFKSVEILLFNQNTNNCKISLNNEKGNFSVLCLEFEEDADGTITVANKHKSGYIRVYLYREQASNTLKLIGQAKQRDKTQLFFDCSFTTGKYYMFIEPQHPESIVTYTGFSTPKMYLKQQIKSQSYKNNFTEYLPIASKETETRRSKLKRLESKNSDLLKNKKTPLQQIDIQILKQTFAKFIVATVEQNNKLDKEN